MDSRVTQIIDPDLYLLEEHAPVADLIPLFWEKNATHVVITDSTQTTVGVISRKDLLDFLLGAFRTPSEQNNSDNILQHTPVRTLMTHTPIVVQEDDSIEYALQILEEHQFHCLPVVDDTSQPKGLVTFRGLLKGLIQLGDFSAAGFDFKNHNQMVSWIYATSKK